LAKTTKSYTRSGVQIGPAANYGYSFNEMSREKGAQLTHRDTLPNSGYPPTQGCQTIDIIETAFQAGSLGRYLDACMMQ
jgi:hypothetical protein